MFRKIFRKSNKSTNSHQLSQILFKLANAKNTSEKQQIIESHPELLDPEAHTLLSRILAEEKDKEVVQRLASIQDILQFCQEVGFEKAFHTIYATDHMNQIIREAQNLINNKHYQQCTELLQKEILKISLETHPLEWSLYHRHLGNSLFFAYGIQSERLEEIIDTYQQVLVISTSGNSHARLQAMHVLTLLYSVRKKGERTDNIEKSIDFCHQILNMITPENNLDLWFKVKAQLAQNHLDRKKGSRKENLDQAISLYNEITEMSPRDTMPDSFVLKSVTIPWKTALDELTGMHIFHSSQTIHKQAMMKFIYAESWSDSRQVLEETPELLTDEIESLLHQMIENTLDENSLSLYKEHLALLQRCRLVGFDTAFYEKQEGSVDPVLIDVIFLAPILKIFSTISEHPKFLTDATFQMLETISESLQKGDDSRIYYGRKARLEGLISLLRRCREVGTEQAIAERMLEEIPFPYPEDAPKELKEEQARLAKVMHIFSPEEQAKISGLSE